MGSPELENLVSRPPACGVRTLRRRHGLAVEVGLGVLPKLEPAANCDLCDEASGRMKKALPLLRPFSIFLVPPGDGL